MENALRRALLHKNVEHGGRADREDDRHATGDDEGPALSPPWPISSDVYERWSFEGALMAFCGETGSDLTSEILRAV